MTDPGSPLLDFIKTMAVLGGILALAWAAMRLWLPRLTGSGIAAGGNAIEVVARRPLEARKTLYVVRVGKSTLLVAAAGETVTLLDRVEFDGPVEAAPSFADQLKAWRGTKPAAGSGERA